jgi:hypothetical protein
MGYRSNVAYTIRFTGDDDTLNRHTFYTFIAEAKSKEACRAALEDCDVDEQNLRINFTAEEIKWYDNIPIVKDHEELLLMASDTIETYEDMNECIGYIFIRTGENEDDNEVRAKGLYNFDWLWVKREIIKDW